MIHYIKGCSAEQACPAILYPFFLMAPSQYSPKIIQKPFLGPFAQLADMLFSLFFILPKSHSKNWEESHESIFYPNS
ncbi:MAG: hypothetical protein DBY39_00345 [Clostridiales bacterium]|nr:MAG: hypothetical protein DBY39_00345 [Clostridiales bacterium]